MGGAWEEQQRRWRGQHLGGGVGGTAAAVVKARAGGALQFNGLSNCTIFHTSNPIKARQYHAVLLNLLMPGCLYHAILVVSIC